MFCFLKDVGCGNNVVAGNPVYNHPKQHTFVNSPYFIYLWVLFFFFAMGAYHVAQAGPDLVLQTRLWTSPLVDAFSCH